MTEERRFNLMFKTFVGPVEDEASVAYLRPETAGGIFPPLAFVKGKGHAATNQCVVPVKVVGGQFKPLSDDQFSCAPGWKPVTP